MSWVTDVLVTFNLQERFDDDFNLQDSCESLDNINAWLKQNELGELDELSKHVSSGGKGMQCYVYGGAFNFMQVEEFIALVLSQPWKMPASVMLLTKDEEEEAFTLHRVE